MSNYGKLSLVFFALAIGLVSFAFGFRVCEKGIVTEDEPMTQCNYNLTGWQLLEMAIMMTESDFNADAVGKTNDVGILQITPTYVKEVNRLMDTTKFTHTDAFDVMKSLEMFNTIQNIKNPEHDIDKAIYLHNPKGNAIGYEERVLRNYRWLVRQEVARSLVIEYGL